MAVAKKQPKASVLSDLFQEKYRQIQAENTSSARNVAELKVGDTEPTYATKGGMLNILDYVESKIYGLGITPSPFQRFVIKMYYHLPLDDKVKNVELTEPFGDGDIVKYRFTEKELLSYLYNEGRCNIKEQDHVRRELILVCGRRSGKTLFSSVFASYELYRLLCLGDPQEYYGIPPNNRIQIISVATDKEQASLLFSELSGHINKFQYFAPYIQNNTQSFINFRTPADIERNGPSLKQGEKFVSYTGKTGIRATFKASVAKGLRGAGNIVIVLDELAHFKNKGQASGKDVYDAVTPSTLAFAPKDPLTGKAIPGSNESRVINISSPLGQSGHFYDLWCQALAGGEKAKNMLAIQAPTWEMNPGVDREFLRQKYYADPATFAVEFGAQFAGGGVGWLERESDLLACCPPDYLPSETGIVRHPYYVGFDIGLVNDSSVICIGYPDSEGYIHLVYHEKWKAGVSWEESNPHLVSPSCEYATHLASVTRLDFDAIADWIEILSRKFTFVKGIFDRWAGIPLEQALLKRSLTQFKGEYFSNDELSKMAQTVKMLMIDNKLRLYNHPTSETKPKSPHIQELLNLEADYLSKYRVLVHKPKTPNASDDFYDAYSRMVWLCHEAGTKGVYIAPPNQGRSLPAVSSYSSQMRKALGGNMPPRIDPRSKLGKRLGLRSR